MTRILALGFLLTACGGEATPPPAPVPAAAKVKKAKKKAKNKAKKKAKGPKDYDVWKLPPNAHKALTNPKLANETAPDEYKVLFKTTKGDFTVHVHRDWAPNGADQFYNLVKIGFYDDIAFFRNIRGFMVQFGISGYPEVSNKWRNATIKDDEVKQSNKPGYVTFAKTGAPNSRSTQVFINFGDNARLDRSGFSPFGTVDDEGMKVVNKLHNGYGEGAPRGRGPNQGKMQALGNAYLKSDFPKLDYVVTARIVDGK